MDNIGNADIDSLINKYEENNSKKNNKTIKLIIVIASCTLFVASVFALCIALLLRSPYDEGKDTPETNFYGCICDTGSSSTRVSVYTWPHRKSNSIPVMTEVGRNNTKSGMHKLNDNEITMKDITITTKDFGIAKISIFCRDPYQFISVSFLNKLDILK